jgi:hypothetical protein
MLAGPTSNPMRDRAELDDLVGQVLTKLRPHGLKSLRAVPEKSGSHRYSLVATASPPKEAGKAEVKDEAVAAIAKSLPVHGKKFVERAHASWWDLQLAKPTGKDGKVWKGRALLNGTEADAIKFLGQNTAAHEKLYDEYFRGKPGASPENSPFERYVFVENRHWLRLEFTEKLGDGAIGDLQRAGLPEVESDDEKSIIEEMTLMHTRPHYGKFDPFLGRSKDADPDLVREVEQRKIIPFLEVMAKEGVVGSITWDRFSTLWNTDSNSHEFIANKFRSAMSGMHEWIPTDQLCDVVETAFSQRDRGGLDWIKVHHELRSPTNMVIWRIVNDDETEVAPGAHVGTFYGADGKSRFTKGTVDFHDKLRDLFQESRGGSAKSFVDKVLAPTGKIVWTGNVDGLPESLQDEIVAANYRRGRGDLQDPMSVRALGRIQERNYAMIHALFTRVSASLSGG